MKLDDFKAELNSQCDACYKPTNCWNGRCKVVYPVVKLKEMFKE